MCNCHLGVMWMKTFRYSSWMELPQFGVKYWMTCMHDMSLGPRLYDESYRYLVDLVRYGCTLLCQCHWQNQDLRTVYIATQRSVAEYAAAAWTPCLSSSNIEKLERTQLQAARAITHHVRSTPTDAVLYEDDLPRPEHRFKTLYSSMSVSYLHCEVWLLGSQPHLFCSFLGCLKVLLIFVRR